MSLRLLMLAATTAVILTCGAAAQQNHTRHPIRSHLMPMAADDLPQECRTAAQVDDQGQTIQGMDMQTASDGTQGIDLTEAQKGYLQSMMKMRDPMQIGIMAKNPDVGFICGMIPHHQGAIDMAEVELKTGNNPEARRLAERVIREQRREITEMKEWLKKYANKAIN
jgi:uncharacterized protein (DUF305 family)